MKKLTALILACVTAAILATATGCAGPASSSSEAITSASSATSTSAEESTDSLANASASSAVSEQVSSSVQEPAPSSAESGSTVSPAMQQLAKDLKPIIKRADIDMGVCAIDLETNERIDDKGDRRMVAASMIKLVVAASFLEAVEEGALSLDDTYTLKETDFVEGTGSLGNENPGTKITYEELFEIMITESDNTAANILIEAMGMKTVNDTAKSLGLTRTKLNRLMMDEEAIARGIENYVSANDVATILELAYHDELISAKASKLLRSALAQQTDKKGILAGLPSRAKFAHKTGSLPDAQHDGGIVTSKDGHDYVIVVLCGGAGFSLDEALDAMEDIGTASYRDLVEKRAS